MKRNDPITICIIDSDELVAMALKHEIEKGFSNHNVFISVFSDALHYEITSRIDDPDVVIMDYRLNNSQKVNGGEKTLIDTLKANQRTHVIVLTSEENAEVAVNSLHHGVHDYIVKNDFMFKKLRLSLLQCFTILELRRNMKQQVSLGIVAIVLVFLMFGVAVGLRTLVPASLMIR